MCIAREWLAHLISRFACRYRIIIDKNKTKLNQQLNKVNIQSNPNLQRLKNLFE